MCDKLGYTSESSQDDFLWGDAFFAKHFNMNQAEVEERYNKSVRGALAVVEAAAIVGLAAAETAPQTAPIEQVPAISGELIVAHAVELDTI